MRIKVAIAFLVCWLLIGLGSVGVGLGWAIRDFIWYGLCCDGNHLVRLIFAIVGFLGYTALTLLFVFHKDFREKGNREKL